MKIKVSIFIIFQLFLQSAISDIKSTTNQIDFKVNNDSSVQMRLNSTGLGVGIINPSTNLHVLGNAIISDQLFIGSDSGSSNLNIHGSITHSFTTISSNQTLSAESFVFVDTSSDNVKVTLPYAGNLNGRVYHIKKIVADNYCYIYAQNSTIDSTLPITLPESSNLGSLKVISDGSNWQIIDSYGIESRVASDNLVGYWPLDASSGTVAYDISGYGLNASIDNLAAGNLGVQGKVGNAMSFDGVDDQVTVPHNDRINKNDDWSVSFWYNRIAHANTFPGVYRKGGSGSPDGYLLWYNSSGRIYYKRNGDQSFDQLSVLTQNTWIHCVHTYDASADLISVYINGSLLDSDTIDYGTNNGTDVLYLGRGDEYANGILDDFRIYNKILTNREIKVLSDID